MIGYQSIENKDSQKKNPGKQVTRTFRTGGVTCTVNINRELEQHTLVRTHQREVAKLSIRNRTGNSELYPSGLSELELYFVDKLYVELSKQIAVKPIAQDVIGLDSRKYYDQAHNYLKTIISDQECKPIATYDIHLSDLSVGLKKELDELLDAKRLESVVKDATLRIFQEIDDEYNAVFLEDDPKSKKFRINLSNEIVKILRVKLVR